LRLDPGDFNAHNSTPWCEFDRIGQQIPHYLLKAFGVP
jgi:hypothetical protein